MLSTRTSYRCESHRKVLPPILCCLTLLRVGFAKPLYRYNAGERLPRHFALTDLKLTIYDLRFELCPKS